LFLPKDTEIGLLQTGSVLALLGGERKDAPATQAAAGRYRPGAQPPGEWLARSLAS